MRLNFLLLFLTITAIGYCQAPVHGIVLEEYSEDPIIGATIYIPELEKGVITNLEGEFNFKELPKGNYELVISSLGYATKTKKIEVPATGKLKILLAPTAIEMEEVVISTPFHQLQSENIMQVERVKMDNLSKSGAVSLAAGISEIAGVSTISTGTGIGKPVIRGLSSNRILVFTQGVRLENQQFGGEHGLGVNSSGVESVEVIKGPASLLYGSDALGGVIYLNPEDYAPADSSQIDFKTTYFTNTQGIESNLGYKTSGEFLKVLVRANYAAHSDYKTGSGKRVTNTRFNEFDLKSGIGYRKNSYKGDLRYNYNTGKTGIPEFIGIQTTSKDIQVPYQQVDNHILSLDNTFYLNNSSIDFTIGYTFNNRKEFEAHHHHEEEPEAHEEENHAVHPALEMHLGTINYDLKYNLADFGNFETTVGVQGMFQQNRNFGEEILIPDAFTADFGILATTHYHLENFDIQGGIRYDTRTIETETYGSPGSEKFIPGIDRQFNSYNGALGMKFDIFKSLTTRINIATGFRAPNLAELTSEGNHHGSNRYEIGNPALENEQNYQIDLALEFRSEHFETFANAFYNSINNYIYLEPTGERIEETPVFKYQQNDAVLYGGEAGIHLHPHPLDWLHFESSYEMVIGERKNGKYLPLMPAHSITNTLRFEFAKKDWIAESYSFLSLKNTFEQNRTSTFEMATNGYSLLSAGIGGTFEKSGKELQVRLSGRNLLNKTYYSHLSRLRPDEIPNIGCNISLSLKIII